MQSTRSLVLRVNDISTSATSSSILGSHRINRRQVQHRRPGRWEHPDPVKKSTEHSARPYVNVNGTLYLIDRNNHLRILHSRQMLNCAGNPNGHVHLRRDNFASLTNLQRVVCIPCIHRCSTRTDRSTQRVSQWVQRLLKRRCIFESTTT